MRLRYYPTVLLLIFLAACTSLPKSVNPTPTVVARLGKFDGKWQGIGKTDNGLTVTVYFTIENSSLTQIYYKFESPELPPCFDFVHQTIQRDGQPQVNNNAFSAHLGPDLSLDAVFQNDSSATGHLTGAMDNYRHPECNTNFKVDWVAEKQTIQIPSTAAQPVSPPHPFETFIQILVFGLSNGAVLALNAIGVTIIYGTVRSLNLAHGDVFALTTVVVTTLVRGFGIQRGWTSLHQAGSLLLVLCGAILAGALLSVGVEQLGYKPFRGSSRLAPVIATLGLSFILYQGALVWRTLQPSWIPGEHRSVPGLPEVPIDGIPNLLPEINLIKAFHLPWNIVIRFSDVFVLIMALLFVALSTWFLQRTGTGRAIRAISQNQVLAQILGINLNQTISRAFAFGGALAGAAAFIFAIYYARPFGVHGAQSGLMAFAAALLGGIGSPIGALTSGLLIGLVSSLSDYYLSAQWTSVVMLALFIALLVWQPTGLTSADTGGGPAVVRDSVVLTSSDNGGALRKSKGQRTNRWLILSLILLAGIPILMQVLNISGLTILRTIGIYIILTLGLNLALGIAGLLDFGFALSYGMGAYATAILSRSVGFVPALLCGILAGAITGVIKGVLGWRLRGDYLAVATLSLSMLGSKVIVNMKVTGGAGGLGNFMQPNILGISFSTPLEKYFIIFTAIVLAIWASQRIINSRTGRTWSAASEDEMAASSVGINIERTRLTAFVLSSALAGLAGALYAGTFSLADPDMLAFHVTTFVLTMVILGGAGNTMGAIAGATIIILYDKIMVPQVAGWLALIWPRNFFIGPVPDIRGANYFNFGIALYLTVIWRARRKISQPKI